MWRVPCLLTITFGATGLAEDAHCESSVLKRDTVLLQTNGFQQSTRTEVGAGDTQEVDPAEFVSVNTTEEEASSLQSPSGPEMEHYRLIKALRARGHTCPDGTYFPPYNGPLEFDCRLMRAAKGWSNRMATEGFEGHRHAGSVPCDRTAAAGYPRGKGCGENLALGDGSPSVAIQQLKDSNDHCLNMMDPDYNMVGVGLVHKPGSRFRYYWTDAFGTYHRRPDQSCMGGSAAPRLPASCVDYDLHNCGLYKKQGQCASNPNVRSHCKDTCCLDECHCDGNHPAPAPAYQPAPAPSRPVPAPVPRPSRGGGGGRGCRDTPGQPCDQYRAARMCYSPNVKIHCKWTCGFCR